MLFILKLLTHNSDALYQCSAALWDLGWIIFLLRSKTVEKRLPRSSRKIDSLDKFSAGAVAVFILLQIFIMLLFAISKEVVLFPRQHIRDYVEKVSADLPQKFGTVQIDSIHYERGQNSLHYYYSYLDVCGMKEVAEKVWTGDYKEDMKLIVRKNMIDSREFVLFRRAGIACYYVYKSPEGKVMMEYVVTSEDLKHEPESVELQKAALRCLRKEIALENSLYPLRADPITICNKVTYTEEAELITYDYTISMLKSEMDMVEVRRSLEDVKTTMISMLRNFPTYKYSRASVVLNYYDLNGDYITGIHICAGDLNP